MVRKIGWVLALALWAPGCDDGDGGDGGAGGGNGGSAGGSGGGDGGAGGGNGGSGAAGGSGGAGAAGGSGGSGAAGGAGASGGSGGAGASGGSGGAGASGGSGGAGASGGSGGSGGAIECLDADCGPVPPVAPCPGGIGPEVDCRRREDGECGWYVGPCPPEEVQCGGRAGPTCRDDQFCDFFGDGCDFADAQGICRPRPEACPEIFAPVCGCDGVTYDNGCFAQGAGTDAQHDGECEGPVPICRDLSREVILLGGEQSYGECLEGCHSTLVIGPTSLNRDPPCDQVTLTVCDNGPDPRCTEHGGVLTGAGHDLARSLAVDLDGVVLQDRYGCPDCADGGASTVRLDRHGAQSSHVYETGSPPPELVAADAFVQGLIQGLRRCASDANLSVFPNCVPR